MKNVEELATLEINPMCQIEYFSLYGFHAKVCEFNNLKIGKVDEIQKKFLYLQ